MIFALLLAIFPFIEGASGAIGLYHDVHPQPWGQVAPQSPEWYELCANHYKSFDKDTGLWFSAKDHKFHYCRFKKVL